MIHRLNAGNCAFLKSEYMDLFVNNSPIFTAVGFFFVIIVQGKSSHGIRSSRNPDAKYFPWKI